MSELLGVLALVAIMLSVVFGLLTFGDSTDDAEYWHRRYCESQPYAPDQMQQCMEARP